MKKLIITIVTLLLITPNSNSQIKRCDNSIEDVILNGIIKYSIKTHMDKLYCKSTDSSLNDNNVFAVKILSYNKKHETIRISIAPVFGDCFLENDSITPFYYTSENNLYAIVFSDIDGVLTPNRNNKIAPLDTHKFQNQRFLIQESKGFNLVYGPSISIFEFKRSFFVKNKFKCKYSSVYPIECVPPKERPIVEYCSHKHSIIDTKGRYSSNPPWCNFDKVIKEGNKYTLSGKGRLKIN